MKENNIRTMPYSFEAEQSLLGCLFIDNEIASDVLNVLGENDFYIESHQRIINAIKAVYQERRPIDIVTVADKLDGNGELASVDGILYLTELAQITPSAANYKSYLEIVKRDSTNRKLIRAANEIIEHAQKSDDEADSIQFAESKLYSIAQTRDTSEVTDVRESGFIDVLEKFGAIENDKDAFRGLQTGFFRLDRLTNGLQKSDLIVLAARPGMGKTSFAMNVVEHAAVYDGKVCAVFSLEMPTVQIKQRLLCANANVSMSAALSGKLSSAEWQRLAAANLKLMKSPILIDDSARITPAEILSKCRRIKAKNGRLDLIMVDYIQLMSSGRNDENRTLEVASITRELKIIAKELAVPVLALSQLKRLDKQDKPSLSDLR